MANITDSTNKTEVSPWNDTGVNLLHSTASSYLRSPQQLLKKVNGFDNGERTELFISAVQSIAKRLDKQFVGQPIEVELIGEIQKYEQILPLLQKAFSNKQWAIEIGGSFSSRCDGDGTRFKISPIDAPSSEPAENSKTSRDFRFIVGERIANKHSIPATNSTPALPKEQLGTIEALSAITGRYAVRFDNGGLYWFDEDALLTPFEVMG